MSEVNLLKRKRSSSTSAQPQWNKCLCHVKNNVKGKLTPFTAKSWRTFEESCNKRKDAIWLVMKDNWGDGPKGGHHRQCYQAYTNRGKFNRLSQTNSETVASTTEPDTGRGSRSQMQSFSVKKCIICQTDKVVKTKGKARTREPLTQNISELGSASLLRAARIRNDERVLLQIEGRDTIALEIKYHRSCYKEYVRHETLSRLEDQNCQKEDTSTTSYKKAFTSLADYVQNEIISEAKVISMSQLLELFVSYLAENGGHKL